VDPVRFIVKTKAFLLAEKLNKFTAETILVFIEEAQN